MKTLLKTVMVASSIVLLASCSSGRGLTTSGGVTSSETSRTGAQTGTAPATEPDMYAYGRGNNVSGQAIGGPGATLPERVVYFDFDSAEIRADSRPIVEAHARYLIDNPDTAVILEGNTDERGTREYNIGLGERRGESVRRLMIAHGVPLPQIQVVSYGEERPAVAGQDENSYAQNRRVEITY